MTENIWFWVIFNLFVLAMLAIDLGIFHREAHKVTVREAGIWSVIWISLSLAFNVLVYFITLQQTGNPVIAQEVGLQFLAAYLLEKSLSVDNIFVFVLIFSYFRVPAIYQHRVLFWGIITALVLRGIMILLGAALIQRFEFIIIFFGLFLVFTAIRMARGGDEEEIEFDSNPVVRVLKRIMPISNKYHGENFTIVENGRRFATPLLVVLLLVESSDVIFAVDSIPAVFGITQDPFIVYTSNIFAILGLRSLYFLLAGVIEKFHYLKVGLSIVLGFVGVKMLTESISDYAERWGYLDHAIHFPIQYSLLFIGLVLAGSVVLSLAFPKQLEAESPVHASPLDTPLGAQPPREALED